jgi:hypothetical protein
VWECQIRDRAKLLSLISRFMHTKKKSRGK